MKSQSLPKIKLPKLYNPHREIKLKSPMNGIRLPKMPKISIGRKTQKDY